MRVALNTPNLETLRDLDDVELLHGVDEIVTQFEELDPHEAGEALGAFHPGVWRAALS